MTLLTIESAYVHKLEHKFCVTRTILSECRCASKVCKPEGNCSRWKVYPARRSMSSGPFQFPSKYSVANSGCGAKRSPMLHAKQKLVKATRFKQNPTLSRHTAVQPHPSSAQSACRQTKAVSFSLNRMIDEVFVFQFRLPQPSLAMTPRNATTTRAQFSNPHPALHSLMPKTAEAKYSLEKN
jgi:hypothetical protein